MRKILLLTDFSEASHHALRFARSFFSDTVADFHLLCAHPVEPDTFYSSAYVSRTARTAFADQLHVLATELRQQVSNDWHTFRTSAMPGTLIDVVQDAIRSETYDLVVVGAKKDGTNELFGNSATTLVRHLEANILVVPVDAPIRPVNRVVLAADFAILQNYKLLCPVKDFITLKGTLLTLLTIDTPDKKTIGVERESQIRQFLSPIEPAVARLSAPTAKEGIEAYLNGHTVDLLVTIPRQRGWTDALTGKSVTRSLVYSPMVPVMTLYDNGTSDKPRLIEDLSNLDYAL